MREIGEHTKPLRYFKPQGETLPLPQQRPEKVRAAIITSLRDLSSEGVGKYADGTIGEFSYIKGTLEYAIEQSVRGKLAHYLEIALIITDDTERDLQKINSSLPLKPQREMPWVHPLSMRNRDGELMTSLTRNIPSDFRLLPLKDTDGRRVAKQKFEDQVRAAMEVYGAQILISDHFLCRVQHLIDPRYHNLGNRVLNTHPAISDQNHRFRTPGATPYTDVIERAQGLRGPVHQRTGASFHIIDEGMDTGPVLFDTEQTPVYPEDTWQQVCARNYAASKNLAFVEGIRHYVSQFFPRLNEVDTKNLEPMEVNESIYDHDVA